jgi:signal transduction histidine kinase/CheY-like chemotaxis protein
MIDVARRKGLGARALILAPTGRDGVVAQSVLQRGGIAAVVCNDLAELATELARGAGTALVSEEALRGAALDALSRWLDAQPRWSDFPFVAFTSNPGAAIDDVSGLHLLELLRNVTLLERPVQAVTLVSAVQAALRARARQYDVAAYVRECEEKGAALQGLNDTLEHRVLDRTERLTEANQHLLAEIEEHRRTEEALRQAQKMQAVGQLTGGIAHDFNNLLTVISGNLELLQAKLDDAPRLLRFATAAANGVERAAKLTQQLLAFSRKQHLDARPIDLNLVVRGMDDLLRQTAGDTTRVTVRLASEASPALADQNQVEAALLNLVINARDAMPEGGEVIVTTASVVLDEAYARDAEMTPGAYVELAVQDTGVGMSREVASHAFEPFFTTKGVGKGSGLGLSMVYGFVRQSKGHVRLDSEVGRGTCVHLYLPRAAGQRVEAAPRRTGVPRHEAAIAGGKILIVEDTEEVREIAVSVLADFGFSVVEAADAASALAILSRDPAISVVFSDVVMPGEMSGIDLAKAVAERWPALRLILTSGYAERLVDSDGMPPHIAYLHKPYKPLDLVGMVRSVIDGSDAAVSTVATIN